MATNTTPERKVINALTEEVALEREAQIAQWGQQDHPSLYGETDRQNFERTAEYWKQINEARVQLDSITWDGILIEEVYEALAEVDPLLRRMELVQVAAVALAEIECIDRSIAAGVYEGFEPIPDPLPICEFSGKACEFECGPTECIDPDPSDED